MKGKYIALKEAAELEGIEYNTLVVNIQRSDNYIIRKEADTTNGGRERVLVAVSSLSKKARNIYRERQKTDISKAAAADGEVPWYTYTEPGWYKERFKRHYNEALELSAHIRNCVEYDGSKDKTDYIKQYAAELDISWRTFYRKIELYTVAMAWALEMGTGDNVNYEYMGILSICPKPREPKGRTSLTEEMKAVIENIWFDPGFAVNLCKTAKLYRKFCDYGKKHNWDPETLPSYATVNRYINDIRTCTDGARVILEKGVREFKRTTMVKRRRDIKMLKVMELVVADTHTLDCWVTVTSPNGKQRIVKPCLVGFMDMRSRTLVGWGICEIPNSQIIKEVLISMVLEKKNKNNPFHSVPRILLIDNGKDYTAQSLTGRPRTVRVDLDNDVLGFYSEIGIERDMRSLPYQAWTKGEIERFFGTVCEDFTKDMGSYTGTLTGSTTRAKVVKDIKRMHERGELLDINELADKFEYWALEVYSKRAHSGLKEQKEAFTTPYEVYVNEERYYKPAPPLEYLERMAMVRTERKVYATGIRLFDCDYMHPDLFVFINSRKKVIVRYDHRDVRSINVYDPDTDRLICTAENAQLLNPLAPTGDKELENHLRHQKRMQRQAFEIIARGQMTYEERINAAEIEQTQKALIVPEAAKGQKIVSIPRSNAYLKDKAAAEKLGERPVINDWMRVQAEKAMKDILAMGG